MDHLLNDEDNVISAVEENVDIKKFVIQQGLLNESQLGNTLRNPMFYQNQEGIASEIVCYDTG